MTAIDEWQTRPLVTGRPTSTKPQPSDSKKILILGSNKDLTPRPAGRLTVGRKVTLTRLGCEL
jgi:hypothetical protein